MEEKEEYMEEEEEEEEGGDNNDNMKGDTHIQGVTLVKERQNMRHELS